MRRKDALQKLGVSLALQAYKRLQGNSMATWHCMVADVGCNMLLQVRRIVPVLGKFPYFRLVLPQELEGANMYRLKGGQGIKDSGLFLR